MSTGSVRSAAYIPVIICSDHRSQKLSVGILIMKFILFVCRALSILK